MKKSVRYPMLVLAAVLIVCMMPAAAFAKATTHILTTSETYYNVSDGVETLSYKDIYNYDKKGNCTNDTFEYTYVDMDGNAIKTKYVYASKFNKKSQITQRIVTIDGKNSEKYKYSFKKGKLKKITCFTWDGKWVNNGYQTYNYTAKKREWKAFDNDKKWQQTSTEYLDKKGRTSKYVSKYDDGYSYTTTYKYNKKNQIIKMITKTTHSDGSKSTNSTEREYDKYGRMTKSKTTFDDGSKTVTEYKYKGSFKKNKAYPLESTAYRDGEKVGRTVYKYKSLKY